MMSADQSQAVRCEDVCCSGVAAQHQIGALVLDPVARRWGLDVPAEDER